MFIFNTMLNHGCPPLFGGMDYPKKCKKGWDEKFDFGKGDQEKLLCFFFQNACISDLENEFLKPFPKCSIFSFVISYKILTMN